MNIRDNSLASLFNYMNTGLQSLYDVREALNISRLFFEKKFGLKAVDIVLQADRQFSESEILTVHFALKELKNHRPIQHIVGSAFFMEMEFAVNEHVLIPRPETEELVRLAALRCPDGEATVLDIGTGSGCIALGIKRLKPEARVKGIDISEQALEVATANGRALNMPVLFEKADALAMTPVEKVYDLIVSNPPYIAQIEEAAMAPNVMNHEPHLALFVPDADPLLFYRAITAYAARALKPGAWLLTEINPAQAQSTREVFENAGLQEVKVYNDMQDRPRICAGRRAGDK